MNPQDFLALATEILPHLIGQWHALSDGEYSHPRIKFESSEHPGWSILMRMHWRENRLTVSASLSGLDGHLRRDEPPPNITLDPARSAVTLARDINRRVIKHLPRLEAIAQPRADEEARKTGRLEQRAQRLIDASGGTLAGGVHRNGHSDSAYMRELFCYSAGYQAIDASAEVRQDKIKLMLDLPLELAEQVLRLIAPHIGELNSDRAAESE